MLLLTTHAESLEVLCCICHVVHLLASLSLCLLQFPSLLYALQMHVCLL